MIILAIKIRFFIKIDRYILNQKLYNSYFFFLFYKKLIRVIYAMFIVVIKDLELYYRNENFLIRISKI